MRVLVAEVGTSSSPLIITQIYFIRYPIPSQQAGNAPVTSLGLQLSMGDVRSRSKIPISSKPAFESWLNGCDECSDEVKASGGRALVKARASAAWAQDHVTDILLSLRGRACLTQLSILTLVVSVIITCLVNRSASSALDLAARSPLAATRLARGTIRGFAHASHAPRPPRPGVRKYFTISAGASRPTVGIYIDVDGSRRGRKKNMKKKTSGVVGHQIGTKFLIKISISSSIRVARGRPIIVEWERDARHSAGLSLVRQFEAAPCRHNRKIGTIPTTKPSQLQASLHKLKDAIVPRLRRDVLTLPVLAASEPSPARIAAQVGSSGSLRVDASRVAHYFGGKICINKTDMILHAFLCFAAMSTARAYFLSEEECLNYTVYPVEYELTIIPHVYDGNKLYYDGEIVITVVANAPGVRVIELDAVDLEFVGDHVGVWYNNRNIIEGRLLYYDRMRGKIFLHLKEDLKVYDKTDEYRYKIKMSFRKMVTFGGEAYREGIFFAPYHENHVNRYITSTRLHPDRARRMFPCFNNPLFASVFRIRVYLPPAYQNAHNIIGSTCLTISTESRRYVSKDNYTIIEYLPSNQIAPHQMGFHLSYYVNRQKIVTKSNDIITVWAPTPAIDDCNYILNLGRHFIEILNGYSVKKRPITNGPINLVPIPAFIDGYEIDSWNLLTNGDYRMMVIEQYTSAQQKERMSFELAQQLSRVWLGNPGEVAQTRWREHWFKEGMATYLAYYLMSKLNTTYWDMRTYGFHTRTEAMDIDRRGAFHPLGRYNKTLGVHLTLDDEQLISAKTAAVLWMVENWLTSEVFHSALQHYIDSRRGKFVSIEDFAKFLQSETVKCEFFEGYTVSDVLGSWINQPGYPLVHVQVYRYNDTEDVIKLEQKHFAYNNNLRKDYKYRVPIAYTTLHEENCFSCNRPKFIIGDGAYHFKENIDDGWIILNRNAAGYYRVNYDRKTWQRIIQTLKSPQRTKIDQYNRAQGKEHKDWTGAGNDERERSGGEDEEGRRELKKELYIRDMIKLVNDAFALYVAGEIDYNLAKDILNCLDNEDSFVVWDSAFAGFELLKIENAAVGMTKQLYGAWEEFMRSKISSIYKRMADEFERDHQTRIFRSKVMTFACQIGHEVCRYNLTSEIEKIKRKEIYDPDLREACYYEMMEHLGRQAPTGNRFEKEDKSNAESEILREKEFKTRIPEGVPPPERIVMPPNTTTAQASLIYGFVVNPRLVPVLNSGLSVAPSPDPDHALEPNPGPALGPYSVLDFDPRSGFRF
ncbi:Glutamyl aminopeptidase [Eumeta japonica]|uniref:Glutamyl aminopeptidase n=1 Tax=Eumeta variegata TaxID=151549 RepID=A0A4C1W8G6_EUMVA|nr:Glutamyl aminopeptidase [Eumeta japonica]